tara:strand:+ start:18784 stop:19554 length:771 start_codon:yes stop_codon:yes gene_type:complete
MKIAIGITGLYKAIFRNGEFSVSKSIQQMKEKFNADVYYHTWSNRDRQGDHPVPEEFKTIGKFYRKEEPKMNYHPIMDIDRDTLDVTCKKFQWYQKTKTSANKTINATKQHLGYADLFQFIPDTYDLYIKTRWDVDINPKFDFEQFYDTVINEGPVGFMTRSSGINFLDYKSTEHKIVKKVLAKDDASDINHNDWENKIADSLIIHKREHFDPDMVWNLHRKKELVGAEWGWWQLMSKPFGGKNHTSVYGGVRIIR